MRLKSVADRSSRTAKELSTRAECPQSPINSAQERSSRCRRRTAPARRPGTPFAGCRTFRPPAARNLRTSQLVLGTSSSGQRRPGLRARPPFSPFRWPVAQPRCRQNSSQSRSHRSGSIRYSCFFLYLRGAPQVTASILFRSCARECVSRMEGSAHRGPPSRCDTARRAHW
jgi:hypothetical protein